MAAAQSHVSTGRAALDQPTVETNDVGPQMLALLRKEVTQITSTGVSSSSLDFCAVLTTNYLHAITFNVYQRINNLANT